MQTRSAFIRQDNWLIKQKLKALLIAVIVTGGAFYVLSFNIGNKTPYVAPEKEVVEVEKTVSELDTRIEEAQEAAKTEIENKAQQAYQDLYEQLMLEVKTTITDEYLKEIEESNLEDKKKLDSY